MITLRILSAKQIVIGDILDARLKSENNDSMTILSSGCMKVIQLRAGLSRRTATTQHRSSEEGNSLVLRDKRTVTYNQKYFIFYLRTLHLLNAQS